MPKAIARLATSVPIRPMPQIPSSFPISSEPVRIFRSQRPSFIERSARATGRAPQRMCVNVNSAVALVFPPGVFITMIPRSVAASMSMLSTPTPARPTTFSFGAAAMTSSVILVSERTATASTSATSSRIFSGEDP